MRDFGVILSERNLGKDARADVFNPAVALNGRPDEAFLWARIVWDRQAAESEIHLFALDLETLKPCWSGFPVIEDCHYEDPRVVKISDQFIMTATHAVHPNGCWQTNIGWAASYDPSRFEPRMIDLPARNEIKNGVLFPERINGRLALQYRIKPSIWLGYADRLDGPWEDCTEIMRPANHGWTGHIGAGAPPLKRPEGWLNFYHQTRETGTIRIGSNVYLKYQYAVGVALMALEDPSIILARTEEPILCPSSQYQCGAQGPWVPEVVFPTAALDLGEKVLLFCGANDSVVIATEFSYSEIFAKLKAYSYS